MSQAFTPEDAAKVTAMTAQCVMCGLCLPHCPSYQVAQNEADSPRGRLALMAQLAARPDMVEDSQPSLDHCLACGACERVCPAHVKFIDALVLTRSRRAPVAESATGRLARLLSRRPALLAAVARHATSARRLLPRSWRRRLNLDALARIGGNPQATAELSQDWTSEPAGTLLLAGCTASLVERQAVAAIRKIASKLQIHLRVDETHCCGALDFHLGKARAQTPDALPLAHVDTAVAINSGCTAQWQQLLSSSPVSGVAAWLDAIIATRSPRLAATATRVVLHLPCSQQALVGETQAMRRLLARLPGIELVEAPTTPACCGAAGTFFLNQLQIAQQLADRNAQYFTALAPDIIVSANGGCRAQLAQALHEMRAPVRVLHPAELVAERLLDPQ